MASKIRCGGVTLAMWIRCGGVTLAMWIRCGGVTLAMWIRCGGVTLAMWISLQKPEQRRNRANATRGSKLPISSRVDRRAKAA